MVVNRADNVNKSNLIATAGAGIVGATAWGLAGYHSNPWAENGLPSDKFIRQIEEKVAKVNAGNNSSGIHKVYDDFFNAIEKSKNHRELSNSAVKLYQNLTDGSFEATKEIFKETFKETIKYKQNLGVNIDPMLDVLSEIMKAKNLDDLRDAQLMFFSIESRGRSFNSFKRIVYDSNLFNAESWGYNRIKFNAREAFYEAFDPKKQKFINSGALSDEVFDIIKSTAKSIQRQTAVMTGLLGGGLMAAAIYLFNHFGSKKSTKQVKKVQSPPVEIKPKTSSDKVSESTKVSLKKSGEVAQSSPPEKIVRQPLLPPKNKQ